MSKESLHTNNSNSTNKVVALLSAKSLTCIREDRLLFDQLSININAGDIVQVEGPNGSGKTSLLRILAGLSQPYDGQVFFQQQPINKCQEAYHQQLVYLGHLPGVKGEMTAIENLDFNLKLHGMVDNNPTDEILSAVNLTGFEDSLASHLSAGQHRRISLARLYAQQEGIQKDKQENALIWILDEPFTAIDKEGVLALEALFIRHTQQGGCIILTTHQDLITIAPQQIKKITLDYQF